MAAPGVVPGPASAATGRPSFAARFAAFVAERHPHALAAAREALRAAGGEAVDDASPVALERLRSPLRAELQVHLITEAVGTLPETTPGVSASHRLEQAARAVIEDCDGFVVRASIAASLTREERVELLRGMVITRAVDNRLKAFFMGSEVRYDGVPFQGKGFRSLGQEAIYGCALRLRRGAVWRARDGSWRTIRVAVAGTKYAVRAREGYRATARGR